MVLIYHHEYHNIIITVSSYLHDIFMISSSYYISIILYHHKPIDWCEEHPPLFSLLYTYHVPELPQVTKRLASAINPSDIVEESANANPKKILAEKQPIQNGQQIPPENEWMSTLQRNHLAKGNLIFQPSIFRGHVSLHGGNDLWKGFRSSPKKNDESFLPKVEHPKFFWRNESISGWNKTYPTTVFTTVNCFMKPWKFTYRTYGFSEFTPNSSSIS